MATTSGVDLETIGPLDMYAGDDASVSSSSARTGGRSVIAQRGPAGRRDLDRSVIPEESAHEICRVLKLLTTPTSVSSVGPAYPLNFSGTALPPLTVLINEWIGP